MVFVFHVEFTSFVCALRIVPTKADTPLFLFFLFFFMIRQPYVHCCFQLISRTSYEALSFTSHADFARRLPKPKELQPWWSSFRCENFTIVPLSKQLWCKPTWVYRLFVESGGVWIFEVAGSARVKSREHGCHEVSRKSTSKARVIGDKRSARGPKSPVRVRPLRSHYHLTSREEKTFVTGRGIPGVGRILKTCKPCVSLCTALSSSSSWGERTDGVDGQF